MSVYYYYYSCTNVIQLWIRSGLDLSRQTLLAVICCTHKEAAHVCVEEPVMIIWGPTVTGRCHH